MFALLVFTVRVQAGRIDWKTARQELTVAAVSMLAWFCLFSSNDKKGCVYDKICKDLLGQFARVYNMPSKPRRFAVPPYPYWLLFLALLEPCSVVFAEVPVWKMESGPVKVIATKPEVSTRSLTYPQLTSSSIARGLMRRAQEQRLQDFQTSEIIDENSRFVRSVSLTSLSDTLPVRLTNSFIEVAAGMHVKNPDGTWTKADPQIKGTRYGAEAVGARHKVFFSANLNADRAIRLTLPDGAELSSRVAGLSYSDPTTGRSVLLAVVKDSVGQIVGANEVIYTNAFEGVECDVQYINTRASLEQNVILRSDIPDPAFFGLSEASTLQVITEFYDSPIPDVRSSHCKSAVEMKGGERDAESLIWGNAEIRRGRAFALGARSLSNSLPVMKKWVTLATSQ